MTCINCHEYEPVYCKFCVEKSESILAKERDGARTQRDAATRALSERHALAATERETALAKRVEELTKERDEAIQARDVWRDQATRHDQFDPRALGERAVVAESRLDELRRVIAELVRK